MDKPSLKNPGEPSRTDEVILRDILESLAENETIRSGEIDIVVHCGQVTLTGNVADRATRKQAELTVGNVRGVGQVTNQIRIDFSPEMTDVERL